AKVFGIDSNKEHIIDALSLNIIDQEGDYSELSLADILIIAVPVNVIIQLVPKILEGIRDDALVIDVGSSKEAICASLKEHTKRRNFLAAHPIAGTEFSGPRAAQKNLFQRKTNIICEIEMTSFKLQERALQLFFDLGMRIRYMNPQAHDRHIAYVSHLSHISSFMLGKTVIEKEKNERDIFDMAGSGFQSTVRLAKSSPTMWLPIFEQNHSNILVALEEYISNLQLFKEFMYKGDYTALHNSMAKCHQIKDILDGVYAPAVEQ
ncbi:MAG: prephenate dehydrogenase, partial [Bacteroidota bacterium]